MDLTLIGRSSELFVRDIESNNPVLEAVVGASSFLVIGGAELISYQGKCQ